MSSSTYYKPPVRFTLPVGSEATVENIYKAVQELESRKARYEQLHDYYIGNQAVLNRTLLSETAKNNKLVNNFASYIADISANYLLGNPVDYLVPDDAGINIDSILTRYSEQGMSDEDAGLALDAAIYGVAYDLTFTDEDSQPNTVQIDPRNTLMVYDDSVQHRELFAINCAQVKSKEGKTINRITAYTDSEIIDLTIDAEGNELKAPKATPHYFGAVPVVEYPNNKSYLGSFEPVLSLIDAYNTIQSDRVNEREELADAILVLKNFTLDEKRQANLRDLRLLTSVPADGDASYLTKPQSESDADILKQSLADDIHKFSKTPNLSDQNFVGNSSGVALNYKLLAFEEEAKTHERFIEKGLKKRMKLYFNLENHLKQGAGGKTAKEIARIDVVFNRNLPKNDFETSQMIVNLQGIVKDDYLVKQLSFVDNAEKAMVEEEPDEFPEQYPETTEEDIQADIEAKLAEAEENDAEAQAEKFAAENDTKTWNPNTNQYEE